jgi:hypothetical protein
MYSFDMTTAALESEIAAISADLRKAEDVGDEHKAEMLAERLLELEKELSKSDKNRIISR